ncbi:MAG: DNA-binding protein AraC-type [Paenibacillaceae bacterium]|jgi:AraC-like DNA-binding protein|nr:DNA-binding protein AraC-type [Paenibacillaceae bacterium]
MNKISPVVVHSSALLNGMAYPPGRKFTHRVVQDYELEFYTESSGFMMLNDQIYPLHKGDIAFRRPGDITQGILPYNCILICLDLLGNTGKKPEEYIFLAPQEIQAPYANPVLDSIPAVIHPPSPEQYERLFSQVLREFIRRCPTSPLLLKSYALQILARLSEDAARMPRKGKRDATVQEELIEKLCDFMQLHLHERLTLEALGRTANMSPYYLHRIFTKLKGVTPAEYLTKLRIDKARELLVTTGLPVKAVALECGFEQIPYFSQVFKKREECTPSEFRKKHGYAYLGDGGNPPSYLN